jgi:hypothetical protein
MRNPTLIRIKTLKIFLLLLVFTAISSYSYSQQSSLTVNAKTTENENASGYFILTNNAVQDSTWRQELIEGSAYFPFYTVGMVENLYDNNIKIYPNPIGTSTHAQIVISADYKLERLNVINALGQTIYIGEPPIDEFHVNTNKGLFFIQFQNNQGDISTLKLICNADVLVFKLRTENGSAKKSTQANSYTLTFEDLAPDDPEYIDHTEQISIGEAEHQVKDITLDYSLKNIIIEGITSPDAQGLVKTNNESLGSLAIGTDGSINQQTFHCAFSKTKSLPISIEISDDNADQIVLEEQAQHNQVIEIDTVLTYNYSLYGTACSPVGALVEIYDESELLGNDNISSTGEYQINWTTKAKQLEVDSVRVSMSGYIEEKQTNVVFSAGNNVLNFNLDQIKYQYQLLGTETSPIGSLVEVFDENQLLGSATVDAQGDYQIEWESTLTNMVIDSIVFSAEGYITEKHAEYNISKGTTILNAALELIKYQYELSGTECSPTGTTAKVFDDGVLLGSAIVDGNGDYQINWESTLTSMVIDSIVFSADAYLSEVLTEYSLSSGANTLDASLDLILYPYTLSGTETSPISTLVEVYEEGILLGSANVDTNGDYSISWESVLSSTVVDSIKFSATGYVSEILKDYSLSTGNNTLEATLDLVKYPYTLSGTETSPIGTLVEVYEESNLLGSASVDANGDYSISWESTLTSMVADSIVFSADGYVPETVIDYSISTGSSSLDAVLELVVYQYTLSGTESSPVGTLVEVYEDGLLLGSANVDASGDYQINWESILTQMVIDSIRFTASGYVSQAFYNYEVNSGANVLEASLNQINTYTISGQGHLIGAVIDGEPNDAIDYLKEGKIRITTLKDGINHDVSIDANGDFSGDITGTYISSDSVLITFVDNPLSTTNTFSVLDASKPASTGKIRNEGYEEYLNQIWDGITWTGWEALEKLGDFYVASLQASGFVQHTAETTIDKIIGKNLYFVAMSDSAFNNVDAIDMIRNTINAGIFSYVEDTLIFVNYLTNLSTGLPITAAEQQDQQEAIDLLEPELLTRTGIPLAYTKKISLLEFETLPVPIEELRKKAIVHKKNDQAYNSQFGDTPTTWNNARASTRPTDGISLIIRELGGGALCIRDLPSSGSNEDGFSLDENLHYDGLSWIGDVACKAAFIFPETYFRKTATTNYIVGSASSPVGAVVVAYNNGWVYGSDTVKQDGSYSIGINNALTSILDSIVFSASGYETQTFYNYEVSVGENVLEVNLLNTYTISGQGHLIGAVIPSEPNDAIDYLKEGKIRITTLKDGINHDVSIDANGDFSGDITGTYISSDSVLITFVDNPLSTTNTFSVLDASKPASTGKIRNEGYEEYLNQIWDGITWTGWEALEKLGDFYVASLQASGFVQHTAETTIDKIIGKNLYFVAMSDSAFNNVDAIDMIRNTINAGIFSYVEDTLIFVNYLTNLSTGLPITAAEQQDQQEAIDLLEPELLTRTGIPLAYTKKISLLEFETLPVPIEELRKKAIVHKKNDQAYNSQFGDTPTTWNNARASTRPTDGISLIIRELGGGALCIRDLPSSGSNEDGFSLDENLHYDGLSWIGDVACKAAFIFPETYFRKTATTNYIVGSASSPVGAVVVAYNNGWVYGSDTVKQDGSYSIGINNALTSILDSIVFSASGYETQTFYNYEVSVGENVLEVNLLNTYTISGQGHLIGAVIPSEPNDAIDYLKEGKIRITTLKDGINHDVSIDANGDFSGDITGTYISSDSVLITFVDNPLSTTNTFSVLDASKPASTGKIRNEGYEEYLNQIWDGITWTGWEALEKLGDFYVASLQASGFVQHTAETTIDKIIGKNLYFVAMSDSAFNNVDAIDMIRNTINAGIFSYVEDTLIFVNYLTNLSTGLPITAAEQQDQQDAIDLLEPELLTRTGIPLAYTKKITLENYTFTPSSVIKKAIVYKLNDQATNSQFGDTPTAWHYSESTTRPTDGIGLIISELGGGALCIRDLPSSGSNEMGFSYDGLPGHVNGLSWIGDVACKAAFIFPETYFRKE